MLRRTGYTLLALALSTNVMAESDHQSAPMLSAPTKAMGVAELQQQINGISSIPNKVNVATGKMFIETYISVGEPKIAIFWNQEFDDRLSQWETTSRQSKTGVIGYHHWTGHTIRDPVQSGSRILSSQLNETRIKVNSREGLSEKDNFEFHSGFIGTLVDYRVSVIDRKTIMRLTERENSKEARSEIVSDYKKVETDALVGYADYFAEILFSPNSKSDIGFSFLVNIREVETGRIIAKFLTDGTPPASNKQSKSVYVVTQSGYQKKTIVEQEPAVTLRKMGEQLAYDTMKALGDALSAR